MASSSIDRTTKIWTIGGESIAVEEPLGPAGHTAAVFCVRCLEPRRTPLAAASRDGTSRIYITDFDDLVMLAHGRAIRIRTAEECVKYLHREQCPK